MKDHTSAQPSTPSVPLHQHVQQRDIRLTTNVSYVKSTTNAAAGESTEWYGTTPSQSANTVDSSTIYASPIRVRKGFVTQTSQHSANNMEDQDQDQDYVI